MVGVPSKLQLATMANNKEDFYDANIINISLNVHKKWKHRCVFATFGWGVGMAMWRGQNSRCAKVKRVKFILSWNHLYVEINIHDFPAYDLFVGCQVKGYMACPLHVVQMWIFNILCTWKTMCIWGTNVTLVEPIHMGGIVLPSMGNQIVDAH